MPRKAKGNALRKKGEHSAANMLKALRLHRSGMSIRKASVTCGIAYATLRRYASINRNVPTECLATKRLTAKYDSRKIFTSEQEEQLINYCQRSGLKLAKDFRKVAYEMAVSNNLAIPSNWIRDQCAGFEWLRSFKERHPDLSSKTSGKAEGGTSSVPNVEEKLTETTDWPKKKPKLEILSSDDEETGISDEIIESEDEDHIVNIIESTLESPSESRDGDSQENFEETPEIKLETTSSQRDCQRLTTADTLDPLQSTADLESIRVRTPIHLSLPRSSQNQRNRDRTPSIESIEEPEPQPTRTPLNEQNEVHSLKYKEFRATQKRARELHSIEIMIMKERLREARAKADLAELLLQQQKEKASFQISYAKRNST